MKTIEKLMETNTNLKVGNHRVVIHNVLCTRSYYYHNTEIITINWNDKTVEVNDGGYKTLSTTRAINSYLNYIKKYNSDYEIIDNRI